MVELDALSHNAGIAAVMPLPEFVAQYRDRLGILAIGSIGWHDVPAQDGSQPQELEMGSRHLVRDHVVGHITAGDGLVRKVRGNHILNSVGLPQLPNLRAGQIPGSLMTGVVREPDVAYSLDPRVRPRMEHSIVEDAVNRDCGADAKHQRKNCGERKARVADDLPKSEAEILEHNLH